MTTHLFFSVIRPPPRPTLFPYTTLFRSLHALVAALLHQPLGLAQLRMLGNALVHVALHARQDGVGKRVGVVGRARDAHAGDRKSTRLNSSHVAISYAVFCLKKKKS